MKIKRINYLLNKKNISKKIRLELNKFLILHKSNKISVFPDIHLKKGEMSPTGCSMSSEKIYPAFTHLSIGSGISTWVIEINNNYNLNNFEKLFKHLQKKIPGLTKNKSPNNYNKKKIYNFIKYGAKKLGNKKMLKNVESNGDFTFGKKLKFKVEEALPKFIIEKCINNFGCLGSGNTFIELHRIKKNFTKIKKNKIKLFFYIHSGLPESFLTMFFSPRWGLHGKKFLNFEKSKWNYFLNHIVDKKSIECKKNFFPPSSKYFYLERNSYDGELYISAMKYLCNISTANRLHHGIMIKKFLEKKLKIKSMTLINDNIHDSIKEEKIKKKKLFIHRHGTSPVYLKKNLNKIIIPSKPGGETLIAELYSNAEKYNNSICHGTGRKLDRPESLRKYNNKKTHYEISKNVKKIFYKMKNISGENPKSFRSLHEILKILDKKIRYKKKYITKPVYILKS